MISEAVDCRAPDAAQCLRSVPVGKLIDVPYPPYGVVALPTDETSLLPALLRKAVADGSFSRVAIVIGSNRDEGRTFQQDSIGWREADYANGSARDRRQGQQNSCGISLAQGRGRNTGAYLAGAVITDSGQDAGIGGCANLKLTQDFAKYTPVYAYEFATGPGRASRASMEPMNGERATRPNSPISSQHSTTANRSLRCSTPASGSLPKA